MKENDVPMSAHRRIQEACAGSAQPPPLPLSEIKGVLYLKNNFFCKTALSNSFGTT